MAMSIASNFIVHNQEQFIYLTGCFVGATTCDIYRSGACLGPTTEHIWCCLCKLHGIKKFFSRWQTTGAIHGHRWTGICSHAGSWGAWFLAHPFWSPYQLNRWVSTQGDRVWANVPSHVHAVCCRGHCKIQWEAKEIVFPALLSMGRPGRPAVYRSHVYILWTAFSWGFGGCSEEMGDTSCSCSSYIRRYLNNSNCT